MSLTKREKEVLTLNQQKLSDYKIPRRIGVDPPSVWRTRKNALKKLAEAKETVVWAQNIGIKL